MGFRTLVYQTVGLDATFFSAPVERPVLPGKSARCGFCEAAWDPAARQTVEPLMWIECGQIAALDPEGSWLCAKHMECWYCAACGIQLPEFCGPGADPLCDHCAVDLYEADEAE